MTNLTKEQRQTLADKNHLRVTKLQNDIYLLREKITNSETIIRIEENLLNSYRKQLNTLESEQ